MRARLICGCLLALTLALPRLAGGSRPREAMRGDLLSRFVAAERRATLDAIPVMGPPEPAGLRSTLDCLSAEHEVTLDPVSGIVSASMTLRLKATGGPLTAVSVAFDQGLELDSTAASDRSVSAADAIFAPSRIVEMTLDPPLRAGEETTLTLAYAGTLQCSPRESGGVACRRDPDFAYFAQSSFFPFVFDPAAPGSVEFDGLTRDVVLHVPAGNDVVMSGQKVSQTEDGGQTTSRYVVDKPLTRTVGMYALVGKLGQKPIATQSGSATLVFPPPGEPIDDALVTWSSSALDFVERSVGEPLPFARGLSLVRLPKALGDPGTATFGMTLLSDSYRRMGDVLYEETWAHENSHLFWGIVVPETNSSESRLMTEGMATLTELEYTFARHFPADDRDEYLARRFVPIGLDLRAHLDVPSIRVPLDSALTSDFRGATYMLWAYYRTAATLDHLRVTLGEDVFARTLAEYRQRCAFVGCSPSALEEIAEKKSGRDLTTFFERWVTASERPRVVIGFEPTAAGANVNLEKDDARPMTLELWVTLMDGTRVKQKVDLQGETTLASLTTNGAVRNVSASPRHDVLVDVRSAVDGDLDFDGEVDGFDALRCTRLVGQSYTSRGATGLFEILDPSTAFDPRCDVDDSGTIEDADLARITSAFETRLR